MRTLRNICIGLGSTALLLTGSLLLVAHLYEDEIKQYAIQQLNDYLESPINVKDVEVSALKRFPSVSLEFTDLWAHENIVKIGEPDTLFFFHNAHMQFNLLDVLRNDYKLKKIGLQEGFMRLRIDKDGYENYIIWKKAGEKNKDFLVELEQLKGNDIHFTYTNQAKQDSINLFADRLHLSGEFSANDFLMDTDGNLWVEELTIGNTSYVHRRKADITAGININKPARKYSFKKSAVLIDREHDFVIAGFLQNKDDGMLSALKVQGKELDIVTALELLPEEQRQQLKNYQSKGTLDFVCMISGTVSKTQNPGIEASFAVQNGQLTHKPSGYRLSNIQLAGKYSKSANGTQEDFELNRLTANIAEGSVATAFNIKNFSHPHIEGHFSGNFDSEKLARFLNIDTLEHITGNIQANIHYAGQLSSLSSVSSEEFLAGELKGDVAFAEVNFRFKNAELAYHNLTGELAVNKNDVSVKNISGRLKNLDFELSGELKNALPYMLLKDERLHINTTFKTAHLNLDSLLNSQGAGKNYELQFPEDVDVHFTANIGKLTFRKFEAANISGTIAIANQTLKANPLQFTTAGGKVKGKLEVEPAKNNHWLVTSKVNATGMDIAALFYEFENFGQKVMQDKHLKGKGNLAVEFASLMRPNLTLVSEKVLANAKVSISKGELIAFEPMNEIADYFKSNLALRALVKPDPLRQKLAHIKFSELENEIAIKNQQIHIPAMTIKSSALDMEIEGTHTFNNEIDYRMNFYFTDLLTRKKAGNSQFDYVKDDGLGRTRVFLTMKGTVDEPDFGYDMLALKKNVKQEVKQEKQTVKSILKDEFGLYKNDSTVKVAHNIPKEPEYQIVWEEEEEPKKDTPQPPKQEEKGLQRLFKPKQKAEKEKELFEFEEDDF